METLSMGLNIAKMVYLFITSWILKFMKIVIEDKN